MNFAHSTPSVSKGPSRPILLAKVRITLDLPGRGRFSGPCLAALSNQAQMVSSANAPHLIQVKSLPKVLMAGGPDIDARLDLMHLLHDSFDISALGSAPQLHAKFLSEGFEYNAYRLGRRVNPLSDLISVGQIFLLLRRLRPQIVHTFDSKPGVWIRLAARVAGVPIVIGTLPGLGSLYSTNSLVTRLIRFVYERLQMFACRVSDLTVFQNHEDARQFIASGIVSKEKTAIILGSGVSTDSYSPAGVPKLEQDQAKRELGVRPDAIVVCMVGRVIRSKGVLDYVAAARRVRARCPNVQFLLVGADDNESVDRLSSEELSQIREALGWRGPRRDIPAVLALTDIFVFPSAYREGIPRVLLEAASMGLPIITTASPGCIEVVEDDVNGLLVPVHDLNALSEAIIRLIEQPELRRRFGRLSRQRAVQRFDISLVADETRSLYQGLWARRASH